MATITVESPGIASAKEEAAAILFARDSLPLTTPAPEPVEAPVEAPATPTRPVFAQYHIPEPTVAKPVNTTSFRPYQNFDEVKLTPEQQVVRPYIDNSGYSTVMASTTVTTPTEEVTTVSVPTQTVAVQSPLDIELEKDTQYVVKFKQSTIVGAAIVASIFLLLSILCIVNIVSLVTTSAQVTALMQESAALHQTLEQEKANLEEARQAAANNQQQNTYTVHHVPAEGTYVAPTSTTTNSSFFDWLCHSLSQLFG